MIERPPPRLRVARVRRVRTRHRGKLLAQVGLNREQLEERARPGMLAAEDFGIRREMRSAELLLDDAGEQERTGGAG